jgi:predicted nucleic acid-binding protein
MAVVDTSVYCALVDVSDARHQATQTWFRQAISAGESIAAPWILAPELGSAIGRAKGDAQVALRAVQHLISAGVVELVPIGPTLAQRAASTAAQQGIRGCDAIFVALAATLGETLVTFDNEQAARATAVVTVHQPT